MPGAADPDRGRRGGGVVRALALLVALGLGVTAVWLIVTGDLKQTKIGVLLGLWGLLLAAYQVVGVRHASQLDSADSTQIDMRGSADRQREFEHRLEAMLRRQVELTAVEHADMRAEIAALRKQLAETTGGQLRPEPTETTRHRNEAHGHEVLARILARERAAHR